MRTSDASNELVAFIAGEIGMDDRLIQAHLPDAHGRCCVCSAGPQAGQSSWPCTLRNAAVKAKQLRHTRRKGVQQP